MIKQKVEIKLGDNPFDTKIYDIALPKGVKLLSNEPYALEMLKDYGIDIENQIFDDTCKSNKIEDGDIIQGTIFHISGNEALIDIGSKYTAVLYLNKEPKEIADQLHPNLKVDIKISVKSEGELIASITDAMDEVKRDEIFKSIGDRTVAYKGYVKELIHGGYWVDVSGIICFMPGSLGGLNKLHDFNSIVNKELIVMPITYSNEKDTIVVSHREYLKTLIPNAISDLKENIKKQITGTITGATSFGVFAEFNECLTGLIPKNELVDSQESFKSNLIKPGDKVKFWVKDIISNTKIILTQTGPHENPWDNINEKYELMSNVMSTVIKKTKYGVFVELEKGISGLIHISELKDLNLNKGDKVNVTVKGIDNVNKKLKLSLY